MRRRELLAAGVILLAKLPTAHGQIRVPTVGFLWIEPMEYRQSFLDGMREKGYVIDRNIRYLDHTVREGYGRFADNAAELVLEKPDVIVSYGGTATLAAAKATREIPIVMIAGFDPVERGLVASLSHPGRNITGISLNILQLVGKRVELLKELNPRLSRVGLLIAPESSVSASYVRATELTARSLKLDLTSAEVHSPDDLGTAFAALARSHIGALIVVPSSLLFSQSEQIVALAAKYRLPSIYPIGTFISKGGLMSYSADVGDQFRRLTTYVDRILKGANAADLPIELPTKFEFVINMNTAKMLGITIPPSLLLRADRVIE